MYLNFLIFKLWREADSGNNPHLSTKVFTAVLEAHGQRSNTDNTEIELFQFLSLRNKNQAQAVFYFHAIFSQGKLFEEGSVWNSLLQLFCIGQSYRLTRGNQQRKNISKDFCSIFASTGVLVWEYFYERFKRKL